jgi:GH15 family glucan-1,4-alpha-glucosidase
MEGFLQFLLNMAQSDGPLHPVYRLDLSLPLPEREHPAWSGYQGNGPVRENNQAAEHTQNDVYGEMILTLAPIFFDERFYHLRTSTHQELIARLARSCHRLLAKPDAGLWELRNGWQEHSFTNLMHWAGLELVTRMQAAGFLASLEDMKPALNQAEAALRRGVFAGSLRNGPRDQTCDAALLQLPLLGFPDVKLSATTVQDIARELAFEGGGLEGFIHRYRRTDDFGTPKAAFIVCSFWLVQSLVRLGHTDRAKAIMHCAMQAANELGLFAEHYVPADLHQRGNFPQAYSHVGQINAAFAISPAWETFL